MRFFHICLLLALLSPAVFAPSGFSQVLQPHPLPEPELSIPRPDFNTSNAVYSAALMFVSGASYGISETLVFRYNRFQAMHPGARPGYWNPQQSWRNKYKNEDPAQGPAFFGSTTFLAWTTDGYHAFSTLSRVTGAAGLTIPLWKGEGKKLRHYAAEVAGKGLIWSAGFHGAYSMLYGQK
jgi:hypothetical protein